MTMVDGEFITEFADLDPHAIALVGKQANGFEFSPMVAKALGELTEEVIETAAKDFADGLCGMDGCGVCQARFVALPSDAAVAKARLKAKQRKSLPDSDFALEETREYPIQDEDHARAALSMLHNASPEEQSKIKAAVHRRYPNIGADKTEGTKAVAVDTGESLSQTNEMEGKQGPVSMDTQLEGSAPPSEVYSQPTPPQANGQGDTSPDKSIPRGEALSQTDENARKAGTGGATFTAAPDGNAAVATAETEAETQTEDLTRKDAMGMGMGNPTAALSDPAANTDPGNPAWEAKDAALADAASHLISKANELIQMLGNRERAEKGQPFQAETEGAIRQTMQAVLDLLPFTPVSKEIEDMDAAELTSLVTKMLDDRDAARAEKMKKKMKKKEKAAAAATAGTGDGTGEGGTGEAAKGAQASEAGTETAAETITVSKAQFDDLTTRLAAVEAQPGARVPLNEAGIKGLAQQGVTLAGINQEAPTADNVFKQLEDDVAKAEQSGDPDKVRKARQARTTAHFMAAEHTRQTPRPGMGVRLMENTDPTGQNAQDRQPEFAPA